MDSSTGWMTGICSQYEGMIWGSLGTSEVNGNRKEGFLVIRRQTEGRGKNWEH